MNMGIIIASSKQIKVVNLLNVHSKKRALSQSYCKFSTTKNNIFISIWRAIQWRSDQGGTQYCLIRLRMSKTCIRETKTQQQRNWKEKELLRLFCREEKCNGVYKKNEVKKKPRMSSWCLLYIGDVYLVATSNARPPLMQQPSLINAKTWGTAIWINVM